MEQVLTTTVANPVHPVALQSKRSYRIDSIDLLRGLIMIIMALDHTRDFIHRGAWSEDPLNFATTTPLLFLTRWITHFCAPVFVFLAGTSGWFQGLRKSKSELSRLLITRGFWLIVVEITLFTFSFMFDPHFYLIGLQTLWAIGISMIILGLAIWLPFTAIFTLGLLIVLGHNSLDFYEAHHVGNYPLWYALLDHQGIYPLYAKHSLLVFYPFLPWTGLMLVGYCFGKLFTMYEGAQRRRVLTRLGIGIILFFIALRSTNLYGDPSHWAVQKNALFTVLSFVNTTKYPPSLLYMCMTIGPAILFVAWAGTAKNQLTRIITVYGRVPFLYYVLHFYLIHLISMLLFLSRGHSVADGIHPPGAGPVPNFIIPGEGYSLWVVYAIWLFVVLAMYPVCKWFSEYKKNHRQWWLSYL
jgi:uncharacterized membrane protein